MKRRVFTRRRQAQNKARFWLRLCAWIGAPATLTMIALEITAQSGMPVTSASAFAVVAFAYSTAVFRLHELTGDWRFF
ncbi:hypothetical protein BAL199_15438 [alpha proteobacterium BAL199]|jgi:hypothetical protein|nr:hypothetical protein BAL199_15438 [alpha proteobacterium BAL199]